MKCILTQYELEELCREWQERLKIQYWDIKIGIFRARDFVKSDSRAEVSWTKTNATAILRILDPVDYDRELWPQDMEVSLVHELLHLRFCEADITEAGSLEDVMLERAIDHTAEALVRLKREAKEVKT